MMHTHDAHSRARACTMMRTHKRVPARAWQLLAGTPKASGTKAARRSPRTPLATMTNTSTLRRTPRLQTLEQEHVELQDAFGFDDSLDVPKMHDLSVDLPAHEPMAPKEGSGSER